MMVIYFEKVPKFVKQISHFFGVTCKEISNKIGKFLQILWHSHNTLHNVILRIDREISWKPEKTSKFRPIHSTKRIWTDFHKNEAKKNSKWQIFQNGCFSKSPFLKNFL